MMSLLYIMAGTASHALPADPYLPKPLGTAVRIQWQAQVHEPGGIFVVYRGHGADFEKVGLLLAESSGSYELADSRWRAGRTVYQLHYRDRHGQDHVVGTFGVQLEVIEPVPVVSCIEDLTGPSLGLSSLAGKIIRSQGCTLASPSLNLTGEPRLEPAIPPPRQG